jgi:hypothetical protein
MTQNRELTVGVCELYGGVKSGQTVVPLERVKMSLFDWQKIS